GRCCRTTSKGAGQPRPPDVAIPAWMTIRRTPSKSNAVPPRKIRPTHTMDLSNIQPGPKAGATRRASIIAKQWGALPPTRGARIGSEIGPDLVCLHAKPFHPCGGIGAAGLPQEREQVQPLQPIVVARSHTPRLELQAERRTNRAEARIQLGL